LKVQLAILTAVVKLFIRKSEAAKDLVTKILKLATEEVDNPDLRDRGFMYWRLLSTNAAAAHDIVLSDKPPISTETDRMDRGSLDQLLLHAGTLGSIYHKSPEVRNLRSGVLILDFSSFFAPRPSFEQQGGSNSRRVRHSTLLHRQLLSVYRTRRRIRRLHYQNIGQQAASQQTWAWTVEVEREATMLTRRIRRNLYLEGEVREVRMTTKGKNSPPFPLQYTMARLLLEAALWR
jgi:hypothetical protein